MDPHVRLKELAIILPAPVAPVANYVPYVLSGNLLVLSGQISKSPDGKIICGAVPTAISLEEAVTAARICAINLIAQINGALQGDLSRVKRIVRLGVFVNSAPNFIDQPKVANGASDLMVKVFGDAGRHARSAVGTNTLPLGVSVEVDGIVEIN